MVFVGFQPALALIAIVCIGIQGRCRIRQAMIRNKQLPNLFLIPAAQTRDKTAVSPSDMMRLCDDLRSDQDFILVDSPAGIERGFRNALAPADQVIVLTNPEISAVRDADRIIGLIEAEEKGAPLLIINRLNPAMIARGEMITPDDVLELLAVKLLGIVPEDENVVMASNRGIPVALDGKSRAGQAFRNISQRLQGHEVPLMDLEREKNLFARLGRMMGWG